MKVNRSVQFFDAQFQQQARNRDFQLNPFELAALPYLRGRVLDYGCGIGNLAFAAAERGCSVLAMDASPAAIAHVRQRAIEEGRSVEGVLADLQDVEITGAFDTVVSIGLLMFFDCATAFRKLASLQAHLREGGVAVINVSVEGTTFEDMFDPDRRCLFSRTELEVRFASWTIIRSELREFEAPRGLTKAFATMIARKPSLAGDQST